MVVIWGLDLHDLQWGKFKGSYMFNRVYHLRRTKMIVYQMAMILCVISESVGTAALSDYVDQQDGIQTRSNGRIHVENNDIIGTFSYNIVVGIAIATIFGSGFFFDLFWPERHESKSVRIAWKVCSLVVTIMLLADQIASTVIVARNRAYIKDVSAAEEDSWFRANGPPNPIYRKNADCVASVVIGWLGFPAAIASTYIMWKSINHNEQYGPFAVEYSPKGEEAELETRRPNTIPVADTATNNRKLPGPADFRAFTAGTPSSLGNNGEHVRPYTGT